MFRIRLNCLWRVALCALLLSGSATLKAQSDQLSPAVLSEIILDIGPQQVVGQPLVSPQRILLLDENSNLVPAYDLAADPITLSASRGSLTPNIINDNLLFSGGIIDIESAEVSYAGLSGPVTLSAANAGVTSAGLIVSFNGYDILSATDIFGGTVGFIYPSLPTTIKVRVRNSGDLIAVEQPNLKAYFVSGGGSVKVLFDGAANGAEDELLINLPTAGLGFGLDTLMMVLESKYQPAGSVLMTADTMRIPVSVLWEVTLSLVPGSVQPESTHEGLPFDLAFDISAAGFVRPIDSSHALIRLIDPRDSLPDTLYNGPLQPDSVRGDIISYSVESAAIDLGVLSAWPFALLLEYQLISEGYILSLSSMGEDSLLVLPSVPLPQIQIIETWIIAPNAPTMNSSQSFQVGCRIANLSTTDQAPFTVNLISDGDSRFDPDYLLLAGIPGGDTVSIFYDVVAASTPNPVEIFRIDITSPLVSQASPVDDIALATIEEPALLSIEHSLLGAEAGYINVGEEISLLLSLVNLGEAETSSGLFRIITTGFHDHGSDTLPPEVIDVGTTRGLAFVAPATDTIVTISFELTGRPVDVNTGQPALMASPTFDEIQVVVSQEMQLLVDARVATSNLVVSQKDKELLRLSLTNPGLGSINDIVLKSLLVTFSDSDDKPLDARSVIQPGNSGIFDGATKVGSSVVGAERLSIMFSDYAVLAGQTVQLDFIGRISAPAGSEFKLTIDAADFAAVFAAGPRQGQAVVVASPGDSEHLAQEVYTSVEAGFEESFTIRDNPFNPNLGPAEFQFYLSAPQEITLRLFSLIGEEVYSMHLDESRTVAGLQSIFWDGTNDDGRIVLDGVYVAIISRPTDGAQARLKVAVVK